MHVNNKCAIYATTNIYIYIYIYIYINLRTNFNAS